jgi:hypothetical protein
MDAGTASHMHSTRYRMKLRSIEPTSGAATPGSATALHALAVAPAVGALVMLLVTVGLAAMTLGALSGVAGYRGVKTQGRRDSQP